MEVLIRNLIREAENRMEKLGIADWKQDSFLLAEKVFHISRNAYYLNPQMKTDERTADEYRRIVSLRCKRIPLQHLTGTQEFMGLDFQVNEHVLIPRQDTEILVEEVLRYINGHVKSVGNVRELKESVKNITVRNEPIGHTVEQCKSVRDIKEPDKPFSVLDLCTGSGCIAVSIDKLAEFAKVFASDISEEAIKVAEGNNRMHHTNVTFICSDLFEKIEGTYDVIVSNPPYIKTSEIDDLQDEVRLHDPIIALDGDDDGLIFYRKISREAKKYLKPDGMIFFEIGNTQAKSVTGILMENGFENIVIKKDLAGNDRVISAKILREG